MRANLADAIAAARGATNPATGWRPVPGHPGYAVHVSGLVFSSRGPNPKLIYGTSAGRGYRAVTLSRPSGGVQRIYIHRLIASVFLPIDPMRRHVNHKDGNKQNNAASNLEWCTCEENLAHARRTGLANIDGLRAHSLRLTPEQVRQIRTLRAAGLTYSSIAQAVGCSPMQANRIARGILRKDD